MNLPFSSPHATNETWVRSGVLVGAKGLVHELGGDFEQICADAGLPENAFSDEDYPLSATRVIAFFSLASQACGCEDFGLRLASRQSFSILGPLWLLMQNADTVQQMLADLSRYFVLHTRGAIVSMEVNAEGVTIAYSMTAEERGDDRQVVEHGLALLCKELRRHASGHWQPRAVEFRFSPPANGNPHRRAFGPNISFNQDRNAVTLDADLLARPLASARQGHHELIKTWLEQRRDIGPSAIVYQVETTVRNLLPYSTCTLNQVAQAMALSDRSLQRYLQAAGSSFAEIRDRVRAELAMKYLRQSSLQTTQIAEILGYSDLSALSRSFRRWHGMTARQARQLRTPVPRA